MPVRLCELAAACRCLGCSCCKASVVQPRMGCRFRCCYWNSNPVGIKRCFHVSGPNRPAYLAISLLICLAASFPIRILRVPNFAFDRFSVRYNDFDVQGLVDDHKFRSTCTLHSLGASVQIRSEDILHVLVSRLFVRDRRPADFQSTLAKFRVTVRVSQPSF